MTKRMTAKFPGTCSSCQRRFDAGTTILYNSDTRKAAHADAATCRAAAATPAPAPRPTVTADGKPIADFLLAAKARGLKWPKVSFLAPDGVGQEITLSVAGDQSKVPGSIQVKLDGEWVGRIEPDGKVVGRQLADSASLLTELAVIASDPAAAAKRYGMATGNCSFCAAKLTDAGSIEVGYGPVCARRWGLPHKHIGTPTMSAVPVVEAPAVERLEPRPGEAATPADLGQLFMQARAAQPRGARGSGGGLHGQRQFEALLRTAIRNRPVAA